MSFPWAICALEVASSSSTTEAAWEPDWNSIRGLMVNYVYGGRIDNPFDLRVLDVYLAKYFNSDMLSGRGELAQNLRCPSPSQNVADYIEWIDRLDDSDSPSLFGLPSNIEKSVQRAVSALTVQKLLALGRSTLRKHKVRSVELAICPTASL